MVHRPIPNGILCITQPAHAVVSAQLSRYWGNDLFGSLTPNEDMQLAAYLHDIGWIEWENRPTLNPTTGYPYNFMELPRRDHLHIWQIATDMVRPFSRYAALLTSRHGIMLYNMVDESLEETADLPLIAAYRQKEAQIQADLLHQLSQEDGYQQAIIPENLARNSRLLAVWDWLSLLLCQQITQPKSVSNVPVKNGKQTLMLTPITADSETIRLTPWPFSVDQLTIQVNGRVLQNSCTNNQEMRHALQTASWQQLAIHLVA